MSAAIWDLKMIARMDVFPDPDFPISSTCARHFSAVSLRGATARRLTFFLVDFDDISAV